MNGASDPTHDIYRAAQPMKKTARLVGFAKQQSVITALKSR